MDTEERTTSRPRSGDKAGHGAIIRQFQPACFVNYDSNAVLNSVWQKSGEPARPICKFFEEEAIRSFAPRGFDETLLRARWRSLQGTSWPALALERSGESRHCPPVSIESGHSNTM